MGVLGQFLVLVSGLTETLNLSDFQILVLIFAIVIMIQVAAGLVADSLKSLIKFLVFKGVPAVWKVLTDHW